MVIWMAAIRRVIARVGTAAGGLTTFCYDAKLDLPEPPHVLSSPKEGTYVHMRQRWPTDQAGMQGIPKRSWPEIQPEEDEIPALRRTLVACYARKPKPTCDAERFVLATALLGCTSPSQQAEALSLYEEGLDSDSLCALGQCYQYGMGTEQNDDRAVTYYRRAASAGHAHAHYTLGALYYIGDGAVEEDEAEAVRHFAIAAELGHPAAMYMLGDCILDGAAGLAPDQDAAIRWLVAAGDRGHRGARSRVFALLEPRSMYDNESDASDPRFTDASRQSLRRAGVGVAK